MRIGVDARELCGHATGVGRYLGHLVDEWSRLPAAQPHEFVFYLPETGDAGEVPALSLMPSARVVRVGRASGTRWEQTTLPLTARRDRLDVFFAPAYTGPLTLGCPMVLTIHDLSYLAHPEWFRPRERWRRTWLTRWSARRAARILTDSAFSRDEVVRLLGCAPSSIDVIPLGLGLAAHPHAAGDEGRQPTVLFVGSIFNRRRLPDVIAAFARLAAAEPACTLELVGENRTWPRQDLDGLIATTGVADRIRLRSWIPDAELASLYRTASAFVFLSEYEGFGLTPLEALAHGIPPVLLDTPVAREVCGEAAVFVQRGDIAGTANALRAVLSDRQVRGRIHDAARARLPRYTWASTAERTLAALLDAAR